MVLYQYLLVSTFLVITGAQILNNLKLRKMPFKNK